MKGARNRDGDGETQTRKAEQKNGKVEGRQEPAMMRPCANLWRGFGSEGRQKTDKVKKPKARY